MPAPNDTVPPGPAPASSAQTLVLPLLRHPATPCTSVLALRVRVARTRSHRLRLEYRMIGDWHDVLLPEHNNRPAPRPGLWRHTCLEAFVGTPGSDAYHEFNFSPSGDWAVFSFSRWRQRVADCSPLLRPTVSLRGTSSGLRVSVETPLPAACGGGPRHAAAPLGLSAVIAHPDGRRCYWALAHPCDDPDFHARTGWLATLPPAPLDAH